MPATQKPPRGRVRWEKPLAAAALSLRAQLAARWGAGGAGPHDDELLTCLAANDERLSGDEQLPTDALADLAATLAAATTLLAAAHGRPQECQHDERRWATLSTAWLRTVGHPRWLPWLELLDGTTPAALWRTLERRLAIDGDDATFAALDVALAHADAPPRFDQFLAAYSAAQRKRRGVYFTPPAVAEYLVGVVERRIRETFDTPQGLAGDDAAPAWTIVDPALGDGVFLAAAVRQACARWRATHAANDDAWRRFVRDRLSPRLMGCELSPALHLLAMHRLGAALAASGCRLAADLQPRLQLADALQWETWRDATFDGPVAVIGNPPFAALTGPTPAWLRAMLHGRDPHGAEVASYYHLAGQRLAERKLWLHDDYIRFLRLAQWLAARDAGGAIGFVTGRGLLDNLTFRGVRGALLDDFSSLDIVDADPPTARDAHSSPTKSTSENLFPIAGGVALSVLCRGPATGGRDRPAVVVRYARLAGSRQEKLARLTSAASDPTALDFQTHRPAPPGYRFTPERRPRVARGRIAWTLDQVMPAASSAIVTARDGLVVAHDRAALEQRLELFCDLSISDDDIRQRLFPPPRSARRQRGDTRSWRLTESRRQLAATSAWRACLQPCWYRPLDRRWLAWTPALIDWPRQAVMRLLADGDNNWALVARRQSPPELPPTFFGVADGLVLDGYLRSDNRGNETVFPVWIEAAPGSWPARRKPNFCDNFLAALAAVVGSLPAADDIAAYLYGLFHVPVYRRELASELRSGFPPTPLPRRAAVFHALAASGGQLRDLHLMRSTSAAPPAAAEASSAPVAVAPGHPQWRDGVIHADAATPLLAAPREVWEHRLGVHQACRKWLKDRRGVELTARDVAAYRQVVAAVAATRAIERELAAAVERHGGWPCAFQLD